MDISNPERGQKWHFLVHVVIERPHVSEQQFEIHGFLGWKSLHAHLYKVQIF